MIRLFTFIVLALSVFNCNLFGNLEPSSVSVSSVSVDNSSVDLSVGGRLTVVATVSPSDATDQALTWSSSDRSKVIVSSLGVITGVSIGTATITVTTTDGEYTAGVAVTVTAAVSVSSVSVDNSSVGLLVGGRLTVVATVSPPDATDQALTWSSSDRSKVRVSSSGVITGVSIGTATITVTTTDGEYTDTVAVTVTAELVSVSGVSVNNPTVSIAVSDSSKLIATVSPLDATNQLLTWLSSDRSKVRVSSSGVITGVSSGTATIRVTTVDGNYSTVVKVSIIAIVVSVSGVSVNNPIVSIVVSDSSKLIAIVSPPDATNQSVRWSSSDELIATVSSSGVITGVSSGAATVRVMTVDGNYSTIVNVRIIVPVVSVRGVSVDNSRVGLLVGGRLTVVATVSPPDANQSVTWSSSDAGIVTVSDGVITGVSAGEAKILATSTVDDSKADTVTVTVTASASVRSVTLNKATSSIKVGSSEQLTVSVIVLGGASQSVSWTSSDVGIATVSQGVITGISEGEAKILATSTVDVSKADTVTVTVTASAVNVTPLVRSVTLNKATSSIKVGSSEQLIVAVIVLGGASQSVSWTSSDAGIVTVSQGVITGISEGEAKILATSTVDDSKADTVTVTVTASASVRSVTLNKATSSIKVGSSEQLTVSVIVLGGASQSVSWTSSDAGIATVSQGVITGISEGEAKILATSTVDVSKADTVTVTVTASASVRSVTLNKATSSIKVGSSEQLTVSVIVLGGASQSVSWTSSDVGIATVSQGVITGISEGEAKILATSTVDVSKADTVTVTVTASASVRSVTLNKATSSIKVGSSEQLTVSVIVLGGASQSVSWTSSDAGIATVSQGVITGISEGEAKILATSTVDDSKADTVTVTVTASASVRSVTLNKATSSIKVGSSEQLAVSVIVLGGASQSVSWTSSDAGIATVSQGVITGISEGEAKILATSTVDDSKADTVTVTVTASASVRSVTLNKATSSIKVGSSEQLTVSVIVLGGASQSVSWTSSDAGIATVSQGVITGISEGEAKILATSTVDDSKADTVTVTVTASASVRSVTLNKATSSIKVGSSEQLTVSVIVLGGASQSVSWTSSDAGIATVSQGVITGISEGEAKILATSTVDDSKADTVTVTVTASASVRSVTLNKATSSIKVGSSEQLIVAVIVLGGASQSVSWTSSDAGIATVSQGVITGISEGEAKILATSTVDDSKADTVTVTVTASASVRSVTLNKATSSIKVGSSEQLTVAVIVLGGASQSVSWTSSDAGIATVSQGVITGISAGEAKILATSTVDVSKVDTVTVTVTASAVNVTPLVRSVTLNKATSSIKVGSSEQLAVSVIVLGGASQSVSWTSSDAGIATVSQGVITGISEGEAKILATSTVDDSKADTVTVTVTASASVRSVTLNKATSSIKVGSSEQLTVSVIVLGGASQSVSWTSSDAGIATVSQGVITGISEGEAKILATSTVDDSKADTVTVTVTASASVRSVTLNKATSSIKVGSSEQLTVSVIVLGGASQSVSWTSSDAGIATVSQGVITGISEGEAKILATSTVDDSKADTVTVTVTASASVRSVTLNKATSSIKVGSSEQLTVSVIVLGGASQSVSWTSSDAGIATVSQGVITGISEGEAKILATSTVDVSKVDTVTVTVTASASVRSVTLNKATSSIKVGSSEQLIVAVIVLGGASQSVSWTSSDVGIATVSQGIITGISEGEAKILATSTVDDSKADTVTVTVTASASVRSVTLNKATSSIKVGSSEQLIVAVIVLGGASQSVSWTSSDAGIATVSQGVITGISEGEAKILATSTVDVSKADTVTVTVTASASVRSVTLNKATSSIKVGSSEQLTVSVIVLGGASQSVSWTSSDVGIATVSQGVITGISEGEAKILATSTVDVSKADTVTVTVTASASVRSVTLNKATSSIKVGSSEQLTVSVIVLGGASQSVSWTSSDAGIATVSQGVITGISEGEAKILATSTVDDSKADTVTVTVTASASVRSVTLNKATSSIKVGSSEQLIVAVIVLGGASQSVTWTSSDNTIATVNSSGEITALIIGTAIITVTSTVDTTQKATATITVIAATVSVSGVNITSPTVSIVVGDASPVEATVLPANATNQSVTWSSSDSLVATIDANGVITGVSVGTANIIVETTEGEFKDTVVVTVTPILVTGVTLNTNAVTVGENSSARVLAMVVPSEATNQAVTWTTSDTTVATVDSNGVITGVLVGTADIIVTTTEGEFKDTVVVTITPILVTGVTLNTNTVTVGENSSARVLAMVVPSDAADTSVSWTTSDTTVATVDSNGVITGVSVGTADIIVTTTEGEFKDTVVVTITPILVTGVTLEDGVITVVRNATVRVMATVVPSEATNQAVTWTTSDSSVATVGSNGVITGVSVGTANIIVETTEGEFKDTVVVTVTSILVTGVTLNTNAVTVVRNATVKVVATVVPSDALDRAVTWSSSDSSVVTVDLNGVITGVSVGIANIIVEKTDRYILNRFKDTVVVTVVIPAVISVSLDKTRSGIVVGAKDTVTATVVSVGGDAKTVNWRTSDAAVATIDANGVITGVSAGTAVITATSTTDLNKIARLEMIVANNISTPNSYLITHTITDFYIGGGIDRASQVAAISNGDKTTNVNSQPYQVHIGNISNATITHNFTKSYKNGVYKYYGNNNAINTMNGATVQFIIDDTVVVETVTISDATKDITVIPDPSIVFNKVVTTFPNPSASFYEIEILGSEATQSGGIYSVVIAIPASYGGYLEVGESLQLSAIVSVATYRTAETVTWESSDPTIATVDSSGEVRVVSGGGTATITAISTVDPTVKGKSEIIVLENISTAATITHTIENVFPIHNSDYDTEAKVIVAISDGDDTTDASSSERYQVQFSDLKNPTITHNFSKTYKNGVYTYYGRDARLDINNMNGSTVQFMLNNIVVETVTISDVTKDIRVASSLSIVFNKVVTNFNNTYGAFYEIEVLGLEVIGSVGGVYSVEITAPASYGGYLEVGESLQLSAKVLANLRTATTVTWESSDSAIATVNQSGEIMALVGGTATITAISIAETTQTATFIIGVRKNISTGATITHAASNFIEVANSEYDTDAKMIAAISDGDKTTVASSTKDYQVSIGYNWTSRPTITHTFSKTYKNAIYTYYGRNDMSAIDEMDDATVSFMNDTTVVQIDTIKDPTQDITVISDPSTVFNKVVTSFRLGAVKFYEIEILGVEVTE